MVNMLGYMTCRVYGLTVKQWYRLPSPRCARVYTDVEVLAARQSLERALRFSFEEAHVWQQYALSLVAAGRPERALFVLEEAVRLNPGQTVLLLLAARTCYQNLHQVLSYQNLYQILSYQNLY